MYYSFAADRKLVFVVQAGGRKRLVEFGERGDNGVSLFTTTDENVAQAIRRSSMSRRGIIVETTVEQKPETRPEAAVKTPEKPVEKPAEGNVREYDNFTVAREAITREFSIPKSEVRNPTALDRAAKEHGFSIIYKNAEK